MFKNIEGQRVPKMTFKTRREHEWVDLASDDVFAGNFVRCAAATADGFDKLSI